MEKSLQPQLRRAERVSQADSVRILAGKRAAQKSVAGATMTEQGQCGVSVGRKYRGVRRDEFGGRGYNNDKY